MRILLVDDHPMVLFSLRQILEESGHRIVAVQSLADARASLAADGAFDLLLLDFHLQDGTALDLLAEERAWPPRIAVISGLGDEEDVRFVLEKTAALAFIPKDVELASLVLAVAAVSSLDPAHNWLWRESAARFVDAFGVQDNEHALTPREREVLMLMREGLKDQEIADRLNRSVHTIRVQVRAIRNKRGHGRRAEVNV